MRLQRKYAQLICKRNELDLIMYGTYLESSQLRISLKWILVALYRYKCSIDVFGKEGLYGIIGYMRKVTNRNIFFDECEDDIAMLKLLRKYMLLFKNWGTILGENWNCLAQASSLFVALHTLGFDVELVVGKFVYCASDKFEFHSWVEYKGVPVNDKQSVYERCIVVYRYNNI